MRLNALVVDDERLARSRLCALLAQCAEPPVAVVGEAANSVEALELAARLEVDVVLLDIHMPGLDGRALAAKLRALPRPPAVVFVTAHAQHALQAFELDALDYLTKPVRLARLALAMQKVQRQMQPAVPDALLAEPQFLTIQDRGRTERIPLADVVYLRAELKYVTVRTATRSLILDSALSDLEERHGNQFLRVHRSILVTRQLIRALEKVFDDEDGDSWAVRLLGIDELLPVSRRQLPVVRDLLGGGA